MHPQYRLPIDESQLREFVNQGNRAEAYDVLAQPLHVWLYEKQDFIALKERSSLEQLILAFDYVQAQVGQGGFIQLVQNGYASLLVVVIESLQSFSICDPMVKILDDALKVMVLNREELGRERSVDEFGKLYQEFTEFEDLEKSFLQELPATLEAIVHLAMG